MDKKELIEEIKSLISSTKDETIEINPKFLDFFEVEELVEIKDRLLIKKETIRETTFDYLDELYEKTKEDAI